MCELQWDSLAEIYLKKQENPLEVTCLCSRVFIRNKDVSRQSISVEQSASEDDIQNEEELSYGCVTLPNTIKSTSVKNDNEHETTSCYCSASHTDNFSTDEHDSLRDAHEATPGRGIQQSDSGADLTEHVKYDIEADWNKFWSLNGEKLIWESWIQKYSAYINPDFLQYTQDAVEEATLLSATEEANNLTKSEKFTFDEREVNSFNSELFLKELKQVDRAECSNGKKETDLKNRTLLRNLSGSDEKLFTEVSEGWNPLSPLSIDCETEAERLLSSRCGSHASSSVRTVDSMTNVTHMTISSLDTSSSTSSSDSISSISSVNSSIDTEDSDEDYQSQWNVLWKTHYEEEYYKQYNKFIGCMVGTAKSEPNGRRKVNSSSKTGSLVLPQKGVQNIFQTCIDKPDNSTNLQVTNTLGDLLSNLNMSGEIKSDIEDKSSESECEEDNTIHIELTDMEAMGLPTSFRNGHVFKTFATNSKNQSTKQKSGSDDSGKKRIKAAFNLIGIEFHEVPSEAVTGQVDYKMKHIRLQNRHLKIRPEVTKPKHIYFDGDGNPLQDKSEEMHFHSILSDNSDNKLSSCDEEITPSELVMPSKSEERKKRKKKHSFPPEMRENAKLRKYWHKRFSLFSKFDQGIKLDEESWYSVTPEKVAKHTGERCRCNVIVDAFCGAGGNTIQFALTCNRVIAVEIDPKKIEMAQNNAKVYGVAGKIDFIVGDFLQLAESLRADAVFLSPPWGGPSYLNEPVYELEEKLQPVPLSKLLAIARQITPNIAVFLPRNSNTYALMNEAGPGGRVEIEQNFLNKKLIAITAYYSDLIKEK